MNSELIDQKWYWVSEDGKEWWPAKYYARSHGLYNQWCNEDTWYDFEKAIRYWKLIPEPEKIA